MKKAKKVTLKQKAKKAGLSPQLVYNRVNDGWSEKKALSVPVRKRSKNKPKDDQLWGTEARKKKVAYKVEPSEVQRSGSRVKKPIAPLPIQKYEAKRNNKIWYIIAFFGLIIIVAVVNA